MFVFIRILCACTPPQTKLRSAIKKGKGIEEEKNRLAEENESLKQRVAELEQEVASLNEKLSDQEHKLQNAAAATDGAAALSKEQSQVIEDEMVSHDAALEQLRSLTVGSHVRHGRLDTLEFLVSFFKVVWLAGKQTNKRLTMLSFQERVKKAASLAAEMASQYSK